MLSAVLSALLLATDVTEAPEPARLHVLTAATAGASFFDVDPDVTGGGSRGLLLGVKVGLRATRPPLVLGAASLGFMPTLSLRHDLSSARTEWVGSMLVSMTLWRLLMVAGVGYGLSAVGDVAPRHVLEVSAGLSVVVFGGLWIGAELLTVLRVGTPGRTLAVTGTVGWQFDLAPD
jgi:hypothetical protein